MPDNEKYITEAWIDNGKEEEFKRDFLKNLLEQYEHHGNGLDADTVDGKHYEDIQNDITSATSNLVSNFKIGGVTFNAEKIKARQDANKTMKIGFDGIHLYVKNADGSAYEDDVYYPGFTLLPWQEGYFDIERNWEQIDGQDGINLLEAFEGLYEIVDGKLSKEEFRKYEQKINEADDMIQALKPNVKILYEPIDIDDPNSEMKISGSEINASSINGMRIYIIGKREYQELDPEIKNDIHNLFIIKENENGFDDFLKARQPNTAPINKYYEFKVDLKDVIGEDGQPTQEYWLWYRHQDLDDWHDMCPISKFINYQAIESSLIKVLANSSDYVINPESLIKTLREITFNDNTNIGIVDYIKENAVRGAISNNFKPANASSAYLPIQNSNGVKYLQLDTFGQEILNKVDLTSVWQGINDVTNNFNNLISNNGRIKGVETLASSNQTEISGIQSQLEGISTQLTNIENRLDSIGTWVKYSLPGYEINGNGGFFNNYYNETLKLAYVSISFSNSFKGCNQNNSWYTPQKTKTMTNYSNVNVKAIPTHPVILVNRVHPHRSLLEIEPESGSVYVKYTDSNADPAIWFTCSGLYKYNRLL